MDHEKHMVGTSKRKPMKKIQSKFYGEKMLEEAKQKVEAKRRMYEKYPQMKSPDWGKMKKKESTITRVAKKLKKIFDPNSNTMRTTVVNKSVGDVAKTKQYKRMRGNG